MCSYHVVVIIYGVLLTVMLDSVVNQRLIVCFGSDVKY